MVMAIQYGKRTTKDLVQMFVTAASEQGRFVEACDPRRANIRYEQMAKIYSELRDRGRDAQRKLLPILESSDPYVRLNAAVFALDFDPESAVPVLEEISEKETGELRVDARMTLKVWREGKLRFP